MSRVRLDPSLMTGQEITGAQLPPGRVGTSFSTVTSLPGPQPATYAVYRELRKDPTTALARALSAAPIMASAWSVEVEDDDVSQDWTDLIDEVFMRKRDQFVESAIFGMIDYGWEPYEKVFAVEDGNKIVLRKIKPLLQDMTSISIIEDTGAFFGFKQRKREQDIQIPLENSLLLSRSVEGTNWYGESLMENVRRIDLMWNEANDGARRYDKKVAGAHFVVYYPLGTSPINGVEKDNFEVANEILNALEASGSIIVPIVVANFVEKLNAEQNNLSWRIEVLEDKGGRQPTFIDRLKYLDTLKVRGLLMPERALMEGQFGTKAEAGVHSDLALTYLDLQHKSITRHLNWHAVDQILRLNFGEKAEGKVFLKPAPLADEALAYLREVYLKLLEDPTGFVEEYETIDRDALKDSVQVPYNELSEQERVRLRPQPMPGMDLDQLQQVGETMNAGNTQEAA